MRVLPFLIVACLGLGLGYGFAQLALKTPDDSWRPGGAPIVTSDAPQSSEPETQLPVDVRDPSSIEGRLQKALASLPENSYGEPVGSISGVAFDRDGEPLVGLGVYAEPSGAPPGWKFVDLIADDFETYVRKRVAQHRFASELRRRTVTDAEGRFTFDGLHPVRYHIAHDGREGALSITVNGRDTDYTEPGGWVDIFETGAVDLTLDVRLPDGSPAETAEIALSRGRSGDHRTWTTAEPTLSVPPGATTITATVPGYGAASLPPMDLPSGAAVGPLRIDLLPTSSLILVADLPDGVSRGEVHFYWMVGDPGAQPEPSELIRRGIHAEVSKWSRDRDPQTEPISVAPGHYWIAAGYAKREMVVVTSAEVNDRPVTANVILPVLEASRSVRIVVLGLDGRPDNSSHVRLEVAGFHDTPDPVREDDGSWLFPLSERMSEFLDQGAVFAEVGSSTYGSTRVPVRGLEETVQLTAPARVSVEVVGKIEGRDYSIQFIDPNGGEQSIYQGAEESVENAFARLQGNGERTPIQPGVYEVRVREEYAVIHREEVRLVGGDQDLRLTLPVRNTVRVRFPAEVESDGVMLVPATNDGMTDAEIVNGVAVFEGLMEGRYTLHCSAGLMTFSVTGDAELDFELLVPNALEVTAVNWDGEGVEPSWVSDFAVGDVIVALNGLRFDGMEELEKIGMQIGLLPEIELTVVRDGAERMVKVQSERMFGEGLSIVPIRR